jgi:hypothetical protein
MHVRNLWKYLDKFEHKLENKERKLNDYSDRGEM